MCLLGVVRVKSYTMPSTELHCISRHGELLNTSRTKTIFEGPGNTAFDRFFDEFEQLRLSATEEPPHKRRRVETPDNKDSKILDSRIPIACVTLKFDPGEYVNVSNKTKDSEAQVSAFHNTIDVCLLEAEKVGEERRNLRLGRPPVLPFPCPIKLTLVAPQTLKNFPCVTIETLTGCSQEAFRVLQKVAYLERRSRVKGNGVAYARCHLVREREPDTTRYALCCNIDWTDGASAFDQGASRGGDWEALTEFYPEPGEMTESKWTWSPSFFYESVHSPPVDMPVPKSLEGRVGQMDLYPFQKRAVAWMLDRESAPREGACSSFTKMENVQNGDCYISHLEGVVSSTVDLHLPWLPRGGILAEEMGLGKTCELISLICLNKRAALVDSKIEGVRSGQGLIPSQATLIVTPQTILQQWKDELFKHAPDLTVMEYTGIPVASKSKKYDEKQVLHDFATHDVVITTYHVMAKEVHYATDPPNRSLRRRGTQRERPRSPLVRINWWRVCLDEAQMVESGVSAAARVACLLSRENAWAVSGTPLKSNVDDLFGLLIFLKYRPFCDSGTIWMRLITQYKDAFRELFGRIALRHTKEKIRNELRLPPQRRVVLTMPFTAIEEQNYKTMFEDMCEEVGCATDGSPLRVDWDPTSAGVAELMRNWLVRLRQTCLHPQVGGRNRKALGRGKAPLRTVAEVLEVMIDQNETAVKTESRSAISSLLLRAHIIANAKDDVNRSKKALEIYQTAYDQAEAVVGECRAELKMLDDGGANSVSEDSDGDEKEKTPEHAARARSRAALHSALQVLHACAFFVGTAYYQIKTNEALTEPDSDDFAKLEDRETSYYDVAKRIRRELLRESASKAEKLMAQVGEQTTFKVRRSELSSIDSPGGIENMKIVARAEDLANILDKQAKLINKWRSKITELLLKPLVDEDEGIETTGDEYEDSTKQQDTLYAYQDALRAVVADRGTCLTGQDAPLVDYEMKQLIREAREGNGHSPELLLELLSEQQSLKQKPDVIISLRGLIHEARGLETSLQWQDGTSSSRAGAELSFVQQQIKVLGKISKDETNVLTELEKILELIRSTMNQRLEFYRQLQYISDTVAPYKEDLDETLDTAALENAVRIQEAKARTLAQLKTKRRFLVHLRDESNNMSEADRICVICQCPFEQGVLTVCGHQYCKECITHWWRQHRTCPVCKRRLNSVDFHDVTYKPQELHAQEETRSDSEASPDTRSEPSNVKHISIYADISSSILSEIKSIDLNGSYGTKIDTLARHILWLRDHDAGAKSIVFSQYREFLDVLGAAFKQFGIGYSRMGTPKAIDRFKQEASIEVFLLDAKTDSSGLNLVNAQHVFLAEPLINTALELQAIARVHRIGQQRPTTIYMYLIRDTVEEAIYDISVTRRLAHMQKTVAHSTSEASGSATPMLGEAAIDSANSLEMQQAALSKLLVKGKGGGEVVAQDDLWGCLFNKVVSGRGEGSDKLQAEVGRHLRAEAA